MYDVPLSGFGLLPPELQTQVLRHTAVEFTVDWLTTFSYNFKDFTHNTWYNGIAVVKLCYTFKLERMRATGERVLRARFTRGVSSDFKRSDPEWLQMGQAQQTAIENFVARTAIIEPFLELRVLVPDNPDARSYRFYFVRNKDDLLSQQHENMSPVWSELYRGELLRVGDQLQTVFYMDLRDQNGTIIPNHTSGI
jgi:hypothetical protein